MLDAIRAYEEQVGSVAEIDEAMKAGAGHPMGPLTLADFVGWTRSARSATCSSTSSASGASPAPDAAQDALGRLVRAQVGDGFYDYSGEEPANPGI